MAGKGPPPKDGGQRRRQNDPARGDWTELRADDKPKVPKLPARGRGRGAWSPRTRRAWTRWWSDPVAKMWGEADEDLVEHLADVYEEWVRTSTASLAAETRQLRDSLGLTPKGRQDRRWRITTAEVHDLDAERAERAKRSTRDRIRAVDPGAD